MPPVSVESAAERGIPDAAVARLPGYLRALDTMTASGIASVSSEELAVEAGVSSAKLRKDLSHLGSYGVRGVGYDVSHLRYEISRALGLTHDWPVVIVGMGNLGRALAQYGGFEQQGFSVVALLDHDPEVVGQRVGDLVVQPMTVLPALTGSGVVIGVIAAPAQAAQDVADALVGAGIGSILNFAPSAVNVPDGVQVRRVDLASELQILAYHEQRRVESAESGAPADGTAASASARTVGVAR
ncbi:redox-sensing transcriptional repressor [Marihabitans asiaticum]|uniref:Redox-sensing transcriptional repressor Rex n=1 Tax=Marihabitans asiaticum TaxID=415218 RepID=A0A560WDC8_9MICO|nr:redox-sensing transcriptional repressor [Marihabitans asiaticum]